MKTTVATTFLILVLVFASLARSQTESPSEQLKPALQDIFRILDDQELQGEAQKSERRRQIMAAISSGFDFREMSRRVLGRTWHSLSEADRSYFVAQMTKLLENVYVGRLESYTGREVEFVAERIKGRRAQVTTLVEYEESKVPVHYIMQKEQDRWMVYDINIEGVSLIRNYMEQFRTIIREEQYEGLIRTIEEKNRSFAAGTETG